MNHRLLAAAGLHVLAIIFPVLASEIGPHALTAEISANATARAVVAGPACKLRSNDWATALRVRLEAEVRLDRPDLLAGVENIIESDSDWSANRPAGELVGVCVGLPDEVAERDRILRTGDAVIAGIPIWAAYIQAGRSN